MQLSSDEGLISHLSGLRVSVLGINESRLIQGPARNLGCLQKIDKLCEVRGGPTPLYGEIQTHRVTTSSYWKEID